MATKIPKKFTKVKKTFIEKITKDLAGGHFSSFSAFPKGTTFNGQDDKEDIVILIRKHPAVYIPQFLGFLLLMFSPLIFYSVLNVLGNGKISMALWLGTSLFFVLLAITLLVDTFFKWYYSVNIITDERIIDVDFSNILYHKFSEAQLERIEDVSHKPTGIFSSIFDYGTVYIQTAGTKPEFEFDSIPRPRDVQDTLLDLLELKQKGKI